MALNNHASTNTNTNGDANDTAHSNANDSSSSSPPQLPMRNPARSVSDNLRSFPDKSNNNGNNTTNTNKWRPKSAGGESMWSTPLSRKKSTGFWKKRKSSLATTLNSLAGRSSEKLGRRSSADVLRNGEGMMGGRRSAGLFGGRDGVRKSADALRGENGDASGNGGNGRRSGESFFWGSGRKSNDFFGGGRRKSGEVFGGLARRKSSRLFRDDGERRSADVLRGGTHSMGDRYAAGGYTDGYANGYATGYTNGFDGNWDSNGMSVEMGMGKRRDWIEDGLGMEGEEKIVLVGREREREWSPPPRLPELKGLGDGLGGGDIFGGIR